MGSPEVRDEAAMQLPHQASEACAVPEHVRQEVQHVVVSCQMLQPCQPGHCRGQGCQLVASHIQNPACTAQACCMPVHVW